VQSGTAGRAGLKYADCADTQLKTQVKTMLKDMTRSSVIQAWFAAIALVVAAGASFGAMVTVATGEMLLALGLVPPVIVLLLWPKVQPLTASEMLRGTDRDA
jgi:H+/gluconate symporter-like permease